jgi:hypothetical protein
VKEPAKAELIKVLRECDPNYCLGTVSKLLCAYEEAQRDRDPSALIREAKDLLNKARGHNRATRLPKHTERLVFHAIRYAEAATENVERKEGDRINGDGWNKIPCPRCGEDSGCELDDVEHYGAEFEELECSSCNALLAGSLDDEVGILTLFRYDPEITCEACWRLKESEGFPGDRCTCEAPR